MAPSKNFINVYEDIMFIPRPGPGKESRVQSRRVGFLDQVRHLAENYRISTIRRRAGWSHGKLPRVRGRYLQRAVIKTRIVRHRGVPKDALGMHVFYLQREGVGLGGSDPEAFNESGALTHEEAQEWAKSCEKDRHHFRFIVSPENGSELDLRLYASTLVRQMEDDLGTSLSWVGVAHHNTDKAHVHIIVRGRDERGKDLVIGRAYIACGMREKAREIATRELGPRTELDIRKEVQRSVTQARITGLDHDLINSASWNPSGLLDLRLLPKSEHQISSRQRSLQLGRLSFLEGLGLAFEVSSDIWKLEDGFLDKLHKLSVKHDIIKTMHQRMRGISPHVQVSIIEPDKTPELCLKGKVVHLGLSNELFDATYALLEATDRKIYYLSLGFPGSRNNKHLDVGAEVRVTVRSGKLHIDEIKLDQGLGLDLGIKPGES